MMKLGVLFLIAILGLVVWALPAGAEKIRLSDAELDGITAGKLVLPCEQVCVPLNKTGGVVEAGLSASGGLGGGPHGSVQWGVNVPVGGGVLAILDAMGQDPTAVERGSFQIFLQVRGIPINRIFQGSLP